MTLSELTEIVKKHEEEYWDMTNGEAEYTRHTLEHLAKLMGKVGNVVEPREHGFEPSTDIIKTQVIPDLLYYALGMAQAHGVDLEEAFTERMQQNRAKITDRRNGILEQPSC